MGKRIYVKWEYEKAISSQLGTKSYNLGELRKVGVKIPRGFTLTTKAFLDFIVYNGIYNKIETLITDIPSETKAIKDRSQRLRSLFTGTVIPDKILSEITMGYDRLASLSKEKIYFAVRSSSTIEDSKSASFAGLYDTFLRIESFDDIVRSVKRCWQSAFSSRALTYIKRLNFEIHGPREIAMGVIVQEMINQRFAGVMATVNSVSGDPSKILIEYSDQSGEFVVSGQCTPNSLLIDKLTNQIDVRTISGKNGVFLEERYIDRLTDLAKKIEIHFDSYEDIEWVIDRDSSFPKDIIILQARPETIWNKRHLKPSHVAGRSFLNFIPRIKVEV